ncbi:MAG: hypothetical protein Q4B99_05340 [Clostridia bacterium]|nr:hypothetical protein [Clostridia bacterium]
MASFALTAAVESAAVCLLSRSAETVKCSLLCNLLTNPALNALLALAVYALGMWAYLPVLVLGEAAALFIEAYLYRRVCGETRGRALLLSAVANAASLSAGALAQHIWQILS